MKIGRITKQFYKKKEPVQENTIAPTSAPAVVEKEPVQTPVVQTSGVDKPETIEPKQTHAGTYSITYRNGKGAIVQFTTESDYKTLRFLYGLNVQITRIGNIRSGANVLNDEEIEISRINGEQLPTYEDNILDINDLDESTEREILWEYETFGRFEKNN